MTPSERIIELYEDNAEVWDDLRGTSAALEKPWLDRFVALLPRRATVLDIGCGSGRPVAANLITRGLRVTGIDSAPSLIALCRERFPDQEWMVADMRTLDLGRRFDGVIAWHSSFHLTPDEQRALFERLAGHAAPGAHLMFTSGDDEGVRIGEWQGAPLYHSSLSRDEYRALLEDDGFEIVDHRPRDPECGEATVWIARKTG